MTLVRDSATHVKTWWQAIEAQDSQGQRFMYNTIDEMTNHQGVTSLPILRFPFNPGSVLERRVALFSAWANTPLPAHIVASVEGHGLRLTNPQTGESRVVHSWRDYRQAVASL